jgi:hypothetical protein
LAFYVIYHEGNTEENNGYVVFTVDEIFTDQLGKVGGEEGSVTTPFSSRLMGRV